MHNIISQIILHGCVKCIFLWKSRSRPTSMRQSGTVVKRLHRTKTIFYVFGELFVNLKALRRNHRFLKAWPKTSISPLSLHFAHDMYVRSAHAYFRSIPGKEGRFKRFETTQLRHMHDAINTPVPLSKQCFLNHKLATTSVPRILSVNSISKTCKLFFLAVVRTWNVSIIFFPIE